MVFNATFNNFTATSWCPVFSGEGKPEYQEKTPDLEQENLQFLSIKIGVEHTLRHSET